MRLRSRFDVLVCPSFVVDYHCQPRIFLSNLLSGLERYRYHRVVASTVQERLYYKFWNSMAHVQFGGNRSLKSFSNQLSELIIETELFSKLIIAPKLDMSHSMGLPRLW